MDVLVESKYNQHLAGTVVRHPQWTAKVCRSPEQVTKRMDALIADIRVKYHKPAIGKPKGSAEPCDVLIVAHGHILRAFAGRWVGENIASNPHLVLEAGGVGTLRSVSNTYTLTTVLTRIQLRASQPRRARYPAWRRFYV